MVISYKCKQLLKLGIKGRRTLDSYHTWKFVHRPSVNKGSNMNYLSDKTIAQSTGMHIRSCTGSLLHSQNNVYSFALRMLLPIKDSPSRPPLNHLNSRSLSLNSGSTVRFLFKMFAVLVIRVIWGCLYFSPAYCLLINTVMEKLHSWAWFRNLGQKYEILDTVIKI